MFNSASQITKKEREREVRDRQRETILIRQKGKQNREKHSIYKVVSLLKKIM